MPGKMIANDHPVDEHAETSACKELVQEKAEKKHVVKTGGKLVHDKVEKKNKTNKKNNKITESRSRARRRAEKQLDDFVLLQMRACMSDKRWPGVKRSHVCAPVGGQAG